MEISEVWMTVAELTSPSMDFTPNAFHQSKIHTDGISLNTSIVMSPFSISAAIMMLMLGAHGRTESQLSSVIFRDREQFPVEKYHFYKSLTDLLPGTQTGLDIKLSNQLFMNNMFTINGTLREKANKFFHAKVTKKKFCDTRRTANSINKWIDRKIGNNFKQVLSKKMVNERTVVVFVNIVSFKGELTEQFELLKTGQQDFYINRTDKTKIAMMNTIQKARYRHLKTSEVLVLPMKGQVDFVILLPEDMTELPAFEKMLSMSLIRYLNSSLEERIVDVTIPEIFINSQLNLLEYLPKRGVTDIFNKTNADFTNLLEDRTNRIYVSDANHRVFVKLGKNRKSKAKSIKSFNNQHTKFIANRPFVFYIIDKTSGVIVFMGRFLGKS